MQTTTLYKMHMSRSVEPLPEGGSYWWSAEDQSRCDNYYEASVMETRDVELPDGYFTGRNSFGEMMVFGPDQRAVEIGGRDNPSILIAPGQWIGLSRAEQAAA